MNFSIVRLKGGIMENRKGQAAMEFLMTYGWAILAAIIAIGVLAYFGVFSPGKYVPGSALVTAPFYANAWNIQESLGTLGGVNLELRNNGGETFTVNSVAVSNCGTLTPIGTEVEAGKLINIEVLCLVAEVDPVTGLVDGSSFKGDITISYRKAGSNIDLSSSGTITETVTA